MSTIYLDSSALVKRYTQEIGSQWVRELIKPGPGKRVITAEFTLAEVAAAINAKYRAPKGLTLQERDQVLATFAHHCQNDYHLIAVDRKIVNLAVMLTGQYRLRGYDAIHLASALSIFKQLKNVGLSSFQIIAADKDLLAAAAAEGLATDNPNNHP